MALVSYTKPILADLSSKQEMIQKQYRNSFKDPTDIYEFETVFGKELAKRKIPFNRTVKLSERPKISRSAKAFDRERKDRAKETSKRIQDLRKLPSKTEQLKQERQLLQKLGVPSKRLTYYENQLSRDGEISDFSQRRALVFSTPSFIKSVLGIEQPLKNPLFTMKSTISNPEHLQETLDEYIQDVLMRYQRYMERKKKFNTIIQQGFDTSNLTDDWDVIESENARLLGELEELGILWNYKLSRTDIRRDNIDEIIQHLVAFHAEIAFYTLIQFYLDLWNKKYEQIHTFYSDSRFRFIDIKRQAYPDMSLLPEHYKTVDQHLSRTRELREMIERDLKQTEESTIRVLEESMAKNIAKVRLTSIQHPLSVLLNRVLLKTKTLFTPSNFLVYNPQSPYNVKAEWNAILRQSLKRDSVRALTY